jgi:site-specific DNA recombinase
MDSNLIKRKESSIPRAGIYCRISKADPNQPKVEAQEDDCRRLAQANGYEVVAAYADDGISASTFQNRPGWNQLLADITAGKIDVVLATEEERFTRQPNEKQLLALTCTAVGATWHTCRGGIIDPATAEGEFLSGLTGLLARREVRRKAERQIAGNQARRSRGEPLAGVRPFGFELDRLRHRKSESAEVKWATSKILAGGSLRSIFIDWNQRSVLTSRGNPWTQNSVKKLLLRPRNAGLIDVQGEIQTTKGNWQPLVSLEDWQACTAILTDKNRVKPHRQQKWLCSGLARCGVCDSVMLSGSGSGRKELYKVYRCSSKLRIPDGRKHPTIKAAQLDDLIRNEIVKCFLYGNSVDSADVNVVDANRFNARLIEIRSALADLTMLVGSLPINNIKLQASKLNAEEATLVGQLEGCTKRSAAAAMVLAAKTALWTGASAAKPASAGFRVSIADAAQLKVEIGERFDSLELDQRRALVRSMLEIVIGLCQRGQKSPDRVQLVHTSD